MKDIGYGRNNANLSGRDFSCHYHGWDSEYLIGKNMTEDIRYSKNNVNLVVETYGYKYLRFERWIVTRGPVTNVLYGVKVLRFKVFLCMIGEQENECSARELFG